MAQALTEQGLELKTLSFIQHEYDYDYDYDSINPENYYQFAFTY